MAFHYEGVVMSDTPEWNIFKEEKDFIGFQHSKFKESLIFIQKGLITEIGDRAVEEFKKKNSFEDDKKRKEEIEELVHRATRTTQMGGYPVKLIAQWIDDIIFMALVDYRNEYQRVKKELEESYGK